MKRSLATACMAAALVLPLIASAPAATTLAAGCKTNSPMISCSDPPLATTSRSPTATVHAYFQVLNAALQSGDFSALASVYAPNATLTQSNPLGQTTVSHGTAQITAFYRQSIFPKIAGYHFTQDAMRNLTKTTLLSYEHAGSPPLSVAARCSHLFVIKDGKIMTLDWVIFFPGQK